MDLLFTSVFIGIGLAMDCLAVSFAVGGHQKSSRLRAALILALFFGGFQSGMTLLGWLLGSGFADAIAAFDHWVAAGLLFIIGGKMILDGIKDGHEEEAPDIFNLVAVLILAVATSIDALAVGLSFALLHITPLIPAFIIGLISGFFSIGGVFTGGKVGHLVGKRIDLLGGCILILIGVRIVLEHTIWNGNGV
ncbi:MAG TPA: manganese efflux pump MntP family protein [Methanospirillum sp.]|uniref:manganese efflux pump MntP n=1 Tax=Methanospirillum sp. TaxID=45200 RepID=UPI002D0BCDF9|nr:manganese efflux pump MntP family protein [Methanospirillum sp.]HOJ95359.1 manganese efflux pump MntP family protein [Methanospirillum sp.]HPP76840.1 manganese efflux pump MntP family protein [Methanospirillum sp.]